MISNMKFVKFTIPSSIFLSFLLPPPPPSPRMMYTVDEMENHQMHKAVSRTLVGKKRKPARDDCERYRGYFSGHGSLAIRFQGSLRKSHCKDEASQVGWITYLVDLLRYYYWLPGTQITFRDCRSSFVLFPTTFLEKAHDKHWYWNKEGGRNKNCVPNLLSKLSEFLS